MLIVLKKVMDSHEESDSVSVEGGWAGGPIGYEGTTASHKSQGLQREVEVRELVITGLANLVSANSEIGFKQCLPLAYDQDKRKRAIFAHVFARVIGQGTTFHAEDRSIVQSRNVRLTEVRDTLYIMSVDTDARFCFSWLGVRG